jgi:hypothetical protein
MEESNTLAFIVHQPCPSSGNLACFSDQRLFFFFLFFVNQAQMAEERIGF